MSVLFVLLSLLVNHTVNVWRLSHLLFLSCERLDKYCASCHDVSLVITCTSPIDEVSASVHEVTFSAGVFRPQHRDRHVKVFLVFSDCLIGSHVLLAQLWDGSENLYWSLFTRTYISFYLSVLDTSVESKC